MRKIKSLFFIVTLFAFHGFAQTNMTMDRDFLLPYQSAFNDKNCTQFTSVLPYDKEKTEANSKDDTASTYKDLIFSRRDPSAKEKDHLFSAGTSDATIFPLFGASGGYDMYGKSETYDYSGGLHLDGKWI